MGLGGFQGSGGLSVAFFDLLNFTGLWGKGI